MYNYGYMEKISGIYCVKNLINGKTYVGKSSDIKRRFKDHKCRYREKSEKASILYKDIKEFGLNNFSFEILELVEGNDKLNEREIYWISKLNSIQPNGYNKSEGGNRGLPYKISKKQLKEIIEMLQSGKSAKEIKDIYGISIQMVTDINVGRYRKIEGIDYPIRKHPSFSNAYKTIVNSFCVDCGKKIYCKGLRCNSCKVANNELIKYGKNGDDLKNELKDLLDKGYSKIQIGKKYGVTDNAIKKKLKKYKLLP